jgi:hypothetical protein
MNTLWDEIVDYLEGTCSSLEGALELHGADHLLDYMPFLGYLDSCISMCECCNWWVESEEIEDINGTAMCRDCAQEESREEGE